MASVAPDLLCLTFNGLSKTYRVAGYRSGWLVITGPREHRDGLLSRASPCCASTRLCPNVPAQHAVQAALGGIQSIEALIASAGGCYERRRTWPPRADLIPGVDCVRPDGALFLFPRLDPDVHEIRGRRPPRLRPAGQRHILLVQGTGFHWPTPDHLRMVTLPEARVLAEAVERMGNFLSSYRPVAPPARHAPRPPSRSPPRARSRVGREIVAANPRSRAIPTISWTREGRGRGGRGRQPGDPRDAERAGTRGRPARRRKCSARFSCG